MANQYIACSTRTSHFERPMLSFPILHVQTVLAQPDPVRTRTKHSGRAWVTCLVWIEDPRYDTRTIRGHLHRHKEKLLLAHASFLLSVPFGVAAAAHSFPSSSRPVDDKTAASASPTGSRSLSPISAIESTAAVPAAAASEEAAPAWSSGSGIGANAAAGVCAGGLVMYRFSRACWASNSFRRAMSSCF